MPPAPAEPNTPRTGADAPREPEPLTGSRAPLPSSLNRDDEMKSGRPPRTTYEPEGAEGSSDTPKTATDPASGEWSGGPPAPARSDADEAGPSEDQ